MAKYTTDRLVTLLASVNDAVVGKHMADFCHQAAERLHELHLVEQKSLAIAGCGSINTIRFFPDNRQLSLLDVIDSARDRGSLNEHK